MKSDSDTSKQHAAASYVDSEIDSDALDDGSDITTKKRKTRKAATQSPRKKRKTEDDEEYDEEDVAPQLYDSDALDDEFEEPPITTKRKSRASTAKNSKQSKSPRKKRKQEASDVEYDDDLEEGQEVVGVVVQAPKTGRVPPGQISKNTLDFLNKLSDPTCNDRDWCVTLPHNDCQSMLKPNTGSNFMVCLHPMLYSTALITYHARARLSRGREGMEGFC